MINLIINIVISTSCMTGTQSDGNPDTAKWNANFLEFVTAMTRNDQEKVKSFVDFPIKNEGNEIWYLADSRFVMKIDPHKIVPFTETDFDKYYSSIFSLDFRNTLQKLNIKDLFLKGNASSPDIEVVKGSTSKLTATYDKTKQKLTLKLTTLIRGPHPTRFDINYQFDVLRDQEIKFRSVHVT